MAVPTIVSVTPNTGHTGGRALVTIVGTNFREPAPPPATGPSSGVVPQTVRVTFGGVVADPPVVWGATELDVAPPIHDEGAVDVTIENLDDDGVPIVGEAVTLVGAFTYARPDLTADYTMIRVIRSLRREMARQTIENVVITTHVDFDPQTGDNLRLIDVAKLPAIVLSEFVMVSNREWNQFFQQEVSLGVQLAGLSRQPDFLDLSIQITAISDFAVELLALDNVIRAFFKKNRQLFVPKDMNVPNGARDEFQMDFFLPGKEASAVTPRTKGTNLGNGNGTVIIRAVPAVGMPAFVNEELLAKVYPIEEILLTVEKKPI